MKKSNQPKKKKTVLPQVIAPYVYLPSGFIGSDGEIKKAKELMDIYQSPALFTSKKMIDIFLCFVRKGRIIDGKVAIVTRKDLCEIWGVQSIDFQKVRREIEKSEIPNITFATETDIEKKSLFDCFGVYSKDSEKLTNKYPQALKSESEWYIVMEASEYGKKVFMNPLLYCLMPIEDLIGLSGQETAYYLYSYLVKNRFRGKFVTSLEEFKAVTCTEHKNYNTGDYIRRVVVPAIEKINEVVKEFNVSYKILKDWKVITGIQFSIFETITTTEVKARCIGKGSPIKVTEWIHLHKEDIADFKQEFPNSFDIAVKEASKWKQGKGWQKRETDDYSLVYRFLYENFCVSSLYMGDGVERRLTEREAKIEAQEFEADTPQEKSIAARTYNELLEKIEMWKRKDVLIDEFILRTLYRLNSADKVEKDLKAIDTKIFTELKEKEEMEESFKAEK